MSAHFSALDDEEFFVVEGSGWRGRRESDSQVFCHPNSMHAWWHIDKDMSLTSRPHHNHHFLRRRGERGGRASQSFSSPCCWVMVFCTCGRLEPAFGGNRRRGFRLVSPAEGTGALALVRFNQLHDYWRAWTDTYVIYHVRTTTTTTTNNQQPTTNNQQPTTNTTEPRRARW